MEKMKEFKAGDLGKQFRCEELRNKNLLLEQEENDNFRKAVFILNEVRNMFQIKKIRKIENNDLDDLKKRVEEYFITECSYKTEETARLHAIDAFNQIARYVLSEPRTPIYAPTTWIEMNGLRVKVSPTLLFATGDVLEVVKLKTSKPRLANKSNKRDGGAMTSLELYALFQYGRSLIKAGREMTIKASIYYLRKTTDKPGEYDYRSDFWGAGGNVVSIEDRVIGNGELKCLMGCTPGSEECEECMYPQLCEFLESTIYCNIDKNFAPQLKEFAAGVDRHECTKEMCESCDFHHVCSFNKPPVVIKHEKTKKSAFDLELTPSQEEAVNYRKGICRINAGAGTGKTTVISLRVAEMLSEGVKPEEIMLVTYTKTAAEEMRERVEMYNEDFGNEVDVSKIRAVTFNAFGDVIIHEKFKELGFDEDPKLLDNVDKAKIIISLLNKNRISGLDYRNIDMESKYVMGAFAITREAFAICKDKDLNIGEGDALKKALADKSYTRFINDNGAYEELIKLYFEYDNIVRNNNMYEYADQIKMVFELLRKDPYLIEDMGIKHIIVDEFQDSNMTALTMIKEFRNCKCFESLMVVGDDSQAIFSFNDTTPEYIINFFDHMEEIGDDIYLLENHRSTPEIIDFANKINDLNTVKVAKSLVATRASGKPVVTRGFIDSEDEYEYIINGIEEHIKNGTKPKDIAFIGRNGSQLLKVQTLLTNKGITSIIVSPEALVENSRVIAAIDFLKTVNNPNSTKNYLPYLNCLADGTLMEKDSEEILEQIKQLKEQVEGLKGLPDARRKQVILGWLKAINTEDEIYENFLNRLKWFKTTDDLITYASDFELFGTKEKQRRECDYDGVILTTAHSSKGLEWPVVYNSISDYYGTPEQHQVIRREETRRLLFVSATRARDELYITGTYTVPGSKKDDAIYNQFLKESYVACKEEFAPPTYDEITVHRMAKKNKEKEETKKAS